MSEKSLKILYVSAEIVPFMKTGGLADVGNALPIALKSKGHDIRIVMPAYGSIPNKWQGTQTNTIDARLNGRTVRGAFRETTLPGTDIPVYLIEHQGYFNRPQPYGEGGSEYGDNLERFSYFCAAALQGIAALGWRPDVVSCHDWHTGLVPVYLEAFYPEDPFWGGMPSVFTIHNLAYQGRYGAEGFAKTGLSWEYFSMDRLEFYGDVNLMKGGILCSTKVNTVSPRYAKEILQPEAGHGMDGVLRSRRDDLQGIINGVDYAVWNPATDAYLDHHFNADDMDGKAKAKSALQRRLGLPEVDVPVFGIVSRLVYLKGVDLLLGELGNLLARNIQIVILGSGDPAYEQSLAELSAAHPEKMSVTIGYDESLAHQIYAGTDFYLMPSRVEPCGLSQLYAMAYGSVPIVRRTGGLANTVTDASKTNVATGKATGIVFGAATPRAFEGAVARALALFREDRDTYNKIRAAAMCADFSWARSSQAYIDLFQEAINTPCPATR